MRTRDQPADQLAATDRRLCGLHLEDQIAPGADGLGLRIGIRDREYLIHMRGGGTRRIRMHDRGGDIYTPGFYGGDRTDRRRDRPADFLKGPGFFILFGELVV